MFDERGRKFALPENADPNPLDVTLPPGETVRQSMTFTIPADARQLFLAAKYRPFTFQSLLPGELSLLPHKPAAMIQNSVRRCSQIGLWNLAANYANYAN